MKQITLNQIIRGSINGEEMTWQERVENFALIKQYLLGTCRNGSKMYNAINNTWFERMEENWVFDRLCVINSKGQYITGQDYTVEIQRVKKAFVK